MRKMIETLKNDIIKQTLIMKATFHITRLPHILISVAISKETKFL